MTKLVWDQIDSRQYEIGVDRGVYFPANGVAEVWNGLTSVQESVADADERTRYIDGLQTRTRRRPGDFSGIIEAFTYPKSFHEDVLTPRRPRPFGLSYRVKTRNAYKLHLVYNVSLGPLNYSFEHGESTPFRWNFTTTPVPIPDAKPTAHLVIDASVAYSWTMQAFEEVLYGSDSYTASLPSPSEVLELFELNSIVRIIDHGDGTWTATGPDEIVKLINPTTFEIDWPSAVYIDNESYTVHSL